MAAALDRLVGHSRRRGRDWKRALEATRRLRANGDDTSQVFAVLFALNGRAYEIDYIRLLATPDGGRIAYQRVELAERLMDEALTASFPAGCVGAAWVEFMESEHLTVQGLLDESHKGVSPEELDESHPYAWFYRRLRDTHDLIHILTSYGRNSLGELCLLAFTYPETHDLGRALIVTTGYLSAHGPAAPQARKAIREAYRRGKTAAWLPGEDFEALLFEPLDDARRRLGLTPPLAYEAVPPALRNPTIRRGA